MAVEVEWVTSREQVTEFWANSNERIVRSLMFNPSAGIPIFPAIFIQNSQMVMVSEILISPTVC